MSDDFYLHPLSLPPRPNLEQYKKLARELKHACALADPGAIHSWVERLKETIIRLYDSAVTAQVRNGIEKSAQQLEQRWHAFQKSNEHAGRCTLAGAQLFLARAHGFSNWPKFASHVEELVRQDTPVSYFETAADAIVGGDATELKRLLREHPELVRMRSTREHRSTLLHYVSANGVEDFRQKTPRNIVEIAKLLLDGGAAVDAESDAYGGRSTTLGLTATSCHPEVAGVQIPLLELLIDRGAMIDAPDGGSCVVGCLRNGRWLAAEYVASRGARLDLEGAAGLGRLDVVQTFFSHDGSLRPPSSNTQMNHGLGWACEFGHTAVVDFLLRKGVNTEAKLRHGETALHWAAFGAHLEAVKLLLDHGASVDVIDKTYRSAPLGWALHGWLTSLEQKQFFEVVALLVRASAQQDPKWLNTDQVPHDLAEKIRADPRMQAALRGEMPR
jgi:Ankyrin repeats (3 copies)